MMSDGSQKFPIYIQVQVYYDFETIRELANNQLPFDVHIKSALIKLDYTCIRLKQSNVRILAHLNILHNTIGEHNGNNH